VHGAAAADPAAEALKEERNNWRKLAQNSEIKPE
jgi:hypothetical protein